MKKGLVLLLLILLLVIVFLLWWLLGREPARPPILLRTASGEATTEFQLLDSLILDAVDLEPRTGYDVRIVGADGTALVENHLSTDGAGRIPETVIWYAMGVKPCWRDPVAEMEARLPYSRLMDFSLAGGDYSLELAREGRLVRQAAFSIARALDRPVLYAADSRGCPKTGFLLAEEDVWVVGRNVPEGSLVRLWVVDASSEWVEGEVLVDRTEQHGYTRPPIFELEAGETGFIRRLWPRNLTSTGSYDVVAEVVTAPFGVYRAAGTAELRDWISSRTHSGFVVQRRPGAAEPLEMEIAGAVESPFAFRSTFLTAENVYVGVDPAVQPAFIGKTAKVYVVQEKSENAWTTNPSLNDVTGVIETITVNGICGNCWKTLAWAAPLTVGEYDVVLDFDMDGQYTPGVDLIDSLDPVGFTVAEIRIDSVAFNYPGSGAVTLWDDSAAATVTAPEYLSAGQKVEPAAWVVGGSPGVRATFSAVPAVSQAKVWAEAGLGGLAGNASPVTVSFSGGSGQATLAVNTPPAAVDKATFSWQWRYKDVNGTPSAAATMGWTGEHVVYSLLATPQAPQAQPWVGALEVATKAAKGKTTAAEATRAIWYDFYTNAGGLYDVVGGSPRYTGGWGQDFQLTKWLTNYAGGNVGVVNCYDMGKAVVVFANALGANAEYVYSSPFGYLNAVRPIGRGWTNNPFYASSVCSSPSPPAFCGVTMAPEDGSYPLRTSFGNHAFSRLAGQLYDGSGGRVDVDSNPDTGPPHTAWDLDGDDSWTASYRARVVDDNPASSPGTPVVYTFGVN